MPAARWRRSAPATEGIAGPEHIDRVLGAPGHSPGPNYARITGELIARQICGSASKWKDETGAPNPERRELST